MRHLNYFLIIFCFAFFVSSAYAAETPVAKVSLVKNYVQIKTKTQNWHTARVDDKLYVGDQIRTASASLTEVTFLNTGTKLRLSEFAQITVENQFNDVKLSFGKLFMAVVKGKGGMKVKAPVAVAAVLGTVGVVEYNPAAADSTYSVTSIDGNFAVTDNNGNIVNVLPGNAVNMTPDGLVSTVVDLLNVIKNNPETLQGQFIEIGLDPSHIRVDPATGQKIIELDTANPKEKIEINVETGKTGVVDINGKNTTPPPTNTTSNNTAPPNNTNTQPPVTTPPNMGQINNTVPVINQPTYNVPVQIF